MKPQGYLLISILFIFFSAFYLLDITNDYKFPFLAFGYSAQFLVYWWWSQRQGSAIDRKQLILILFAGLAARGFAVCASPLLEDDFWRYLWEAKVLNSGLNPYHLAPDSPLLDHLHTGYRELIGFPHLPALYPPLTLLFFSLNDFVFGESLAGLRVWFFLADCITAYLVYLFPNSEEQKRKALQLYWLCPLVIKEGINSVRFDILVMLFLFAGLFLIIKKRKTLWGWLTLSVASSLKILPLITYPFLWRDHNHRRNLGVLIGLLLPTFSFVSLLLTKSPGSSETFSKEWVFHPSFYELFYQVYSLIGFESASWLGRLTTGALFLVFTGYLFFKVKLKSPGILLPLFLALYLLSPVVNPSYFLWIVPLACTYNYKPLLLLMGTSIFAYSWFEFPDLYFILSPMSYTAWAVIVYLNRKEWFKWV